MLKRINCCEEFHNEISFYDGTYYFPNDIDNSILFKIYYCPFCGTKTEVKENGNV